MSNEPIFQRLARDYALMGKSYERMISPHLSPVRPLAATTQPMTDAPSYEPDPYLDGPYKAPLPKRTLSHFIQLPEPDPEFAQKLQSFISTAPLAILQGTRAGSVLSSFKGLSAGPEIVDEAIRFQETGKLDSMVMEHKTTEHIPADLATAQLEFYRGIVPTSEIVNARQEELSYLDVVEIAEKYQGVVLTKTITVEDLLDGMTSADIIQELGKEFAEKYPNAAVAEVNVGEKFNGDMIVTVRGTLISEEDTTSTPNNPEQTDKSVNAASNEENDDENEPVFVAPNFWKIRDEE